MAQAIKRIRTVLLAVDMGMGKTAAALTAARRLLDEFMVRRVLIIAPLRVAELTWPEEIAEWEHTAVLSYSLITGGPKKRLAALKKDVEVYIINRENLPWLWRTLKKKNWAFDMIIYDESSRLKAGKKRTKSKRLSEFGALALARHKARYVVELTGTPAPGGLKDLWGQVYILDQGKRLGEKQTHFHDRWFDKDYMGWNLEPKKHAEKQIMSRIKDVMIGLRAEDHVDMPPVRPNKILVKLPAKAMKEYRLFEKHMVSEAYDVEAASRGVLTNKLLQFANGSMYRVDEDDPEERRRVVKIHDAKLAALDSVWEEAAGRQVLVAYSFKFDLKQILRRYPKATVVRNDPDWKKKWDRGTAGMTLAHPAEVGHGLNLQHGSNILCWFGMTWSLELYQQFNKRLARPGQSESYVWAHHILAQGTMDEVVYESMLEKDATQDRITQRVRVRILDNKNR